MFTTDTDLKSVSIQRTTRCHHVRTNVSNQSSPPPQRIQKILLPHSVKNVFSSRVPIRLCSNFRRGNWDLSLNPYVSNFSPNPQTKRYFCLWILELDDNQRGWAKKYYLWKRFDHSVTAADHKIWWSPSHMDPRIKLINYEQYKMKPIFLTIADIFFYQYLSICKILYVSKCGSICTRKFHIQCRIEH